MRLFIAIPVPPDIRRAAAESARLVREAGASGRFVPQKNYHVTLRFLGETNALREAADAMHRAVCDTAPFLLRLDGYGTFTAGKSSRHTGFLSIKDESGELLRLYETLAAALREEGFCAGHERFLPHLTLGRSITSDENVCVHRNEAFTADRIVLYESRGSGDTLEYVPLHKELFV